MTTTQPSKIPLGSFDVSCLRHVGRLAVSTQPSACNANNTTGANYRTPSGSAYTWDSSNTAVYAPPRYGSYAVPEVPCTHVMERLPLESACGPPKDFLFIIVISIPTSSIGFASECQIAGVSIKPLGLIEAAVRSARPKNKGKDKALNNKMKYIAKRARQGLAVPNSITLQEAVTLTDRRSTTLKQGLLLSARDESVTRTCLQLMR